MHRIETCYSLDLPDTKRLPQGFGTVKPQTASQPVVRIVSALMAVAGVALTGLALAADAVPVIGGGGAGVGWKQLIAAIVGIAVAAIGIGWFVQPPTSRR